MKVSVVTPSLNQGSFIQDNLTSVARQRDDCPGVDLEHLVFDGGSTDGTPELLRAFRPEPRWVSRPDRGQSHAVNQGILASDGEIIGWLNSDDVYSPGAVAKAVAYLEAHPEVDLVYGCAEFIDPGGAPLGDYPCEPFDLARLHETCFLCQPAVFLRRRVVEAHGLLDESLHYCMDYEYWLRLGRAGARFGFLREKLAGSRVHARTKTLSGRVQAHAETNDLMLRLLGRVPDRWLYNYAHAVVERRVDRELRPRWFRAHIAASGLGAAWRWNRRVSPAMCLRTLSLLLR